MDLFLDQNGCTVRLDFKQHAFSEESAHVIVICRFIDKWLLTEHKQRGWEFPGGKIEPGETPEQTARREVFEETGGILDTFFPLGEYQVSNGTNQFVKTIFFGTVSKLVDKKHYMETNGPVFEEGDILTCRFQEKYSFIMKDDMIKKSLEHLNEMRLTLNSKA